MEQTFDTYKQRTTTYNVVFGITISFFVFTILGFIFPEITSMVPKGLLIFLFLVGFLVTIYSGLIGASPVKTYVKDGDLTLTESSVSVNGSELPLTDLSLIAITAGSYKGKASRGSVGNGTGNKIIITKKDRAVLEVKFVIDSKDQSDILKHIMQHWHEQGFKIISNGIDLT